MNFGGTFYTRVLAVVAAIAVIFLVKEIVRYLYNSWLAFCVFYTMSDLYRKRKGFVRHFKSARKLLCWYFGFPSASTNKSHKKQPRTVEKISLSK